MTTETAEAPNLDDYVYREVDVDPVGAIEIGERLDVATRTVHQWTARNQLPDPTFDQVNGSKAWDWDVILVWAGITGRLKPDSPFRDDYANLTGFAPADYHPRGLRKANDPATAIIADIAESES